MKFVYMFVVILVFVTLLYSTFAEEQLVGGNRCTWGPSYWCKNEKTVKECGLTVEHCVERYGGLKEQ